MILARPAALFLLVSILPAQQWDPFGTGCPGTVGVPVLATAPGSVPRIGCPFTLQLSNLPEGADTFVVFGFSKTNWGGDPLPLDLGQFGLFGCTLYTSVDAILFLPSSGGAAEMTIDIPNWPGRLTGVHFYNQAAVVDPGLNPIGVVSNAGEGVIGPSANFNLAGTWELTSTSGINDCGDPVGVEVVFDVSFVQVGSSLTVTVPGGTLTGGVINCAMDLTGDTFEDGGVASNDLDLTLAGDGKSFTGTNSWSWTDGFDSCSGVDQISGVLK